MIQWKNNLKPKAPFVASIFNYYLSDDLEGHKAYDELTLNLVQEMPGYLGYESDETRRSWHVHQLLERLRINSTMGDASHSP